MERRGIGEEPGDCRESVKCLGIHFRILSVLVRILLDIVGDTGKVTGPAANNASHLCIFNVNTQQDLRCISVSLIIFFATRPFDINFRGDPNNSGVYVLEAI